MGIPYLPVSRSTVRKNFPSKFDLPETIGSSEIPWVSRRLRSRPAVFISLPFLVTRADSFAEAHKRFKPSYLARTKRDRWPLPIFAVRVAYGRFSIYSGVKGASGVPMISRPAALTIFEIVGGTSWMDFATFEIEVGAVQPVSSVAAVATRKRRRSILLYFLLKMR